MPTRFFRLATRGLASNIIADSFRCIRTKKIAPVSNTVRHCLVVVSHDLGMFRREPIAKAQAKAGGRQQRLRRILQRLLHDRAPRQPRILPA